MSSGFTLIELMIVIAIIAILAAILVPNFMRARAQGNVTACKSNLKNIGTASEVYATDNNTRYPLLLSDLAPKYLGTIPTCPSSALSPSYSFSSVSNPDAYTVVCTGNFHGAVNDSTNFPQYCSATGLVEQ